MSGRQNTFGIEQSSLAAIIISTFLQVTSVLIRNKGNQINKQANDTN